MTENESLKKHVEELQRRIAFLELKESSADKISNNENLTKKMKDAKIAKFLELERQQKERDDIQ